MTPSLRRLACLCGCLAPVSFAGVAAAIPPRQERVAARMAERAYARQSIAQARAARAEARVAEIAPLVPLPPPPRPATVRRLSRAGVPPVVRPPVLIGPPPALQSAAPPPAAAVAPPEAVSGPVAERSAPPVGQPPREPRADRGADRNADRGTLQAVEPADDGTRSVLTTATEPSADGASRDPAGVPVTHPPIELLPTPAGP